MTTNANSAIDISAALEEYRKWDRATGQPGDDPECFWHTMEQEGYPNGVDVQIELDEDDGEYQAKVYPVYVDAEGHRNTDTTTLLTVIPSSSWN